MTDDVKTSPDDEEKGAEKLNHEEDTFDHLNDDDCPVLSALWEIVTLEKEDRSEHILTLAEEMMNIRRKKEVLLLVPIQTVPSPKLIAAMRFQKTQDDVTTFDGEK